MDRRVSPLGEFVFTTSGDAEVQRSDQAFAVHYPSAADIGWKSIEAPKRGFLELSKNLRIATKFWQHLPTVSVQRDADSPNCTIVQWPKVDGHVRLYLDISALAGLVDARHALISEVTLSLVPDARAVECDWIALVRRDGRGWFPIHRRIEEKVRFTRTESRMRWTVKLSSEEMQEAAPLFVAVQISGAATRFRLDHFGIRVQSFETDVAAFTACIGGLVEGWTRADDAALWFDTNDGGRIDAGIPVGFGRFTHALSPSPAAAEGATRAFLVSGNEVTAYLDLSSVPASFCAGPADDAPSVNGLSPRSVEWLYEQGKVELLWALSDRVDPAELPDAVRHALTLYHARALLGLNATESAYRGLRSTTGEVPDFEAMPPAARRKALLSLARACLRSGRAEEAQAILREMQAADPLDWECYFIFATIVGESDPSLRRTYLQLADSLAPKLQTTALVVVIENLLEQGHVDEAWLRALNEIKARGATGLELWLSLGNVHLARGDRLNWSASVRRLFSESGLAEPEFEVSRDPAEDIFHRLTASVEMAAAPDQRDLITVIMTTYNAERTVKGAVQSVLAQSYSNLRLVIVDDCSTDDTLLILRQLQARDERIEILQTSFNAGTYCAKNLALSRVESDYFTFHDSDDWMHPERLAVHHAVMRADPRLMCTMSRWYRMDLRGAAVWRRSGGYLHDNPASTFFHRSVVERIGYFDSVRTGADTELVGRIRRRFGPASVRVIAKPLAIGLHHSASLTRSGSSAFNEHRYSAPRVAYWESWVEWHRQSVVRGEAAQDLFMPFPHHPRRFPAPVEIMPDRPDELGQALKPTEAERLRASPCASDDISQEAERR